MPGISSFSPGFSIPAVSAHEPSSQISMGFLPTLKRWMFNISVWNVAQFRRTFTLIFENTWEKRWTTIGKIYKMKISERKAKWSCHVKPLHYWAMWDAHQLQNLECTFKSKIWKPETENNFFFPVQFSYLWDMNDTLHVSYKISLLLKCQVVENQKNILV